MSSQLTALDRCDRCGAQAYVEVKLTASKMLLLFCAHHFRENEDKLKLTSRIVRDERKILQHN